jgi:hypothetical protein
MSNHTGTIFLPTLPAVAIFDHELQGQFSDGMWENSAPHEHWKFWCGLDVQLDPGGEPRVESSWQRPKKTGYNIASLYPIIGDRMLADGRIARAAAKMTNNTLTWAPSYFRAAEYLGGMTLDDAMRYRTERPHHFSHVQEHLMEVPETVLKQFYATTYTMRDMRKDVALIKRAMKSMDR